MADEHWLKKSVIVKCISCDHLAFMKKPPSEIFECNNCAAHPNRRHEAVMATRAKKELQQ
jgi:hypothetical protein